MYIKVSSPSATRKPPLFYRYRQIPFSFLASKLHKSKPCYLALNANDFHRCRELKRSARPAVRRRLVYRQHMALQGRVKIERWPRWIFGSPLVLLLHICVDVTDQNVSAVGPATGL